jgi:hypothetical protein
MAGQNLFLRHVEMRPQMVITEIVAHSLRGERSRDEPGASYPANNPPSIWVMFPVMYEAFSDNKKTI